MKKCVLVRVHSIFFLFYSPGNWKKYRILGVSWWGGGISSQLGNWEGEDGKTIKRWDIFVERNDCQRRWPFATSLQSADRQHISFQAAEEHRRSQLYMYLDVFHDWKESNLIKTPRKKALERLRGGMTRRLSFLFLSLSYKGLWKTKKA